MFTKTQLDQLQKLLESNNKKIRKDVQQDIIATEQTLHKEIQSVEQSLHKEIQTVQTSLHQEIQSVEQSLRIEIQTSNRQLEIKLTTKFDISQQEMIDIITELINTGFNLHEKRIKRIESELNLAPIKD